MTPKNTDWRDIIDGCYDKKEHCWESYANPEILKDIIEKQISSAIEEREKEIVKELKTRFTDEMEDDAELSEWGKGKRKGYNRAIDQIILFIQSK